MDVNGEGEGEGGRRVNHSQANQNPGPDTSDEASEGDASITTIEVTLDDEYVPDLGLRSDSSGAMGSDVA